MRVPTSVILDDLLRDAPRDYVTLGWIVAHLRDRSFGIVLLLVGLLALVPGVSPAAGVFLALPSIQMMRARPVPTLPRFVAARRVPTQRLARLIARATPVLRWMERFVRPRWPTRFEAAKRAVGFTTLLLGGTLLAPIPFSQVIPALAVMLLAFAFLEEDGALLVLALVAAFASLAITGAALWGVVELGLLL